MKKGTKEREKKNSLKMKEDEKKCMKTRGKKGQVYGVSKEKMSDINCKLISNVTE